MIGYVTVEDTKQFLALRYDIANIDDVELSRALYLAFDKIEALNIRDKGKEKAFPRIDEVEIPFDVLKAQMLESYFIITGDDTTSDIAKGIASKSIGDMSISYNGNNNSLNFVSVESANLLSKYVRKTF